MIRNKLFIIIIVIVLLQFPFLYSQNLIPNSGFEVGMNKPDGWEIKGCAGEWSLGGVEGKMVSVFGNGKNSGVWCSTPEQLTNCGIYHFIFYGRKEVSTSGGCAVSGPTSVNRDFHLSEDWQQYDFFFRLPDDRQDEQIRIGHWEMLGRYYFDNCRLFPSIALHKKFGKIKLGEAECIRDGKYFFSPDFGWKGANYHRPLYYTTAHFNSDRWVFSADKELIYKFNIGDVEQNKGNFRASLNYYTGGAVEIAVSKNLKQWLNIGFFDKTNRGGILSIPDSIYPAKEIFVRIKFVGKDGTIQINSLEYNAALSPEIPDMFGETYFIDVQKVHKDYAIQFQDIAKTNNEWKIAFEVSYQGTNKTTQLLVGCYSGITEKEKTYSSQLSLKDRTAISIQSQIKKSGSDKLLVEFKDKNKDVIFSGEIDANVSFLEDPRPGYWLAETKDFVAWWCESGWKIGKQKGAPVKSGRQQPIKVAAAKGEYEPVQIVLMPQKTLELNSVQVSFQKTALFESLPIKSDIYEVAFVPVSHPTDGSTMRGLYPDPLPPLKTPVRLIAGENFVLWVSFKIPTFIPGGDYNGEIKIATSGSNITLPLILTVFDFELPEETHLRSGLGLGTHSINRYHKLQTQEDKMLVYEKYLKNFAEHRISPYSFFDYNPIKVSFKGEGTNKYSVVDFSQFDVVGEKWLDKYHFNSFRLPLRGMGGGTFQSRSLGTLEGYKEGTPEHTRLFKDYLGKVEEHLRLKGWLNKAYTYWFDEPDRKDYEFVVEGMKRIKAAAPGLKRLLTEQPEKGLIGNVDIWCGLTPEWSKKLVEECKQRGEEVWWYICCAPKAPYITEFIDHPGTELRLWPWQSYQYGVQGILIWETVYWTSSLVYSNTLQNPWTDPMSYVSGYDNPTGFVGYWGNGDGRFLYPPKRDPNKASEPALDDPINSIRWENLRDGMEDYEYFWLLEKQIQRAEKKHPNNHLLDEAKKLLIIPEDISANLTNFTTDPRPILQYRERIARMIEDLQKL